MTPPQDPTCTASSARATRPAVSRTVKTSTWPMRLRGRKSYVHSRASPPCFCGPRLLSAEVLAPALGQRGTARQRGGRPRVGAEDVGLEYARDRQVGEGMGESRQRVAALDMALAEH